MQSSNDPRPCARACSTPKKLWYFKSTLTSAQEHSFKLHVRPWAYLYNCGRPSLILAFFVCWLRFCILSNLGTTSQLSTEWCQSLPKQSELPHKDYYEAKNLSLSNTGKDHKTSIYWGQLDLITNIWNLKLGPKLTTLHTGAPTTRGQDWVSPTMEALAAGECQYCFDLYTFLVSDYILTSKKFWHLLF